ncbi:hypothetical protein [Winogradskyella sp. UBA3174]|uniref:hypothetical protein n=1 Tax=Winogradskyella sp. UBA3174 TaxID=1947785 RepID=UPI0025EE5F36|nr:hypothetical protein [Winogradskyella sp. UBA3174]|tara:strand:- start:1760 stop:2221 length:462 start_codon:yes stop_codon:yes gene_type:complete
MNLKLSVLVPFLIVSILTFGQENSKIQIDYPTNVEAPLNKKETAMIKEVFQSKSKELVFNNETFLKDIKHLLRNRILIYEEVNAKAQKQTKMLSEIPLFDDHNKNLKRDSKFDISNFNPLKYKLDFFANGTYVYRIDSTNYFIQVTSQYRTQN